MPENKLYFKTKLYKNLLLNTNSMKRPGSGLSLGKFQDQDPNLLYLDPKPLLTSHNLLINFN